MSLREALWYALKSGMHYARWTVYDKQNQPRDVYECEVLLMYDLLTKYGDSFGNKYHQLGKSGWVYNTQSKLIRKGSICILLWEKKPAPSALKRPRQPMQEQVTFGL